MSDAVILRVTILSDAIGHRPPEIPSDLLAEMEL